MAENCGNMMDMMTRIDQVKKYMSWSLSEPEPSAAYLGISRSFWFDLYALWCNLLLMAGPKLWEKHLSLKEFDEDDFSVMNIEEFLEENNIKV